MGTNIFRLKWGDKQLYTEQGGPTFIAGRRETNVFSRRGDKQFMQVMVVVIMMLMVGRRRI